MLVSVALRHKLTITITQTDDYYYTNLSGSKSYAIKNYKIKGQDYYYIGRGAYIKAMNVGRINGNPVFRDGGATTIVPQTDLYLSLIHI